MSRFDKEVSKAHANSYWKRLALIISVSVVVLLFSVYALLFTQTPINVAPQEASESYDTKILGGVGLVAWGRLLSFSTQVDVQISATGFRDTTLKITQTELGKPQTVELMPLPATVRFSVQPLQEVQWLINGIYASSTPSVSRELPAGDHKLTIVSSSGVRQLHSFRVGRGEVLERLFEIQTVTGKLRVEISPPANLRINGQEFGEREITLSGGQHNIEVTKSGYVSVKDAVSIKREGEVVSRTYVLNPKPLSVNLDLSPPDGLLTVNGARVGVGSQRKIQTAHKETVVITYKKDGFSEVRETYRPSPGDSLQFKAHLAGEFGWVKFSGTSGAVLRIGGEEVGQLPVDIELPTRDHVVIVESPGFITERRTVRPNVDRVIEQSFRLMSVNEYKRANSPKKYQSAFGLEFKLVDAEGERFTMGGKRDEKGQRANEVLRDIKFSKNFYVATTELTQKQFGGSSEQPLVNTPWIEVVKFCNQASQKESLEPFYKIDGNVVIGYNKSANGYRLITEAEWEYVARKVNRRKQTIFVWGDTPQVPSGAGNLADQKSQATLKMYIPGYNDPFPELAPVKSFKSQPEGMFDFIGNASEWVNDSYVLAPSQSSQVEVDPLGGPPKSSVRTVRGSSYLSASLSELRAAFRDGTSEPRKDLGFRLARYM